MRMRILVVALCCGMLIGIPGCGNTAEDTATENNGNGMVAAGEIGDCFARIIMDGSGNPLMAILDGIPLEKTEQFDIYLNTMKKKSLKSND